MDAVRSAVRRYGWAFTAEQAANPGLQHWTDGDAVVAYARARGALAASPVRVAAGDPIGPRDRLAKIARAFEADARAHGATVLWFGATEAFARAHAAPALVIGAEPLIDLRGWDDTVASKASLRAQIYRALNKHVQIDALEVGSAGWKVALPELHDVLAAWLSTRGMPSLHFLAEPNVLAAPGDRRFWIARHRHRIVAFLSLAPVAARPAALAEWILRRPDAPNGTAALLVDQAARACRADGIATLSLGLVPLSTRAPLSPQRPSPAVRALLRWTRAHARRFYHFDGLERFKAKFEPDRWEPSFLLTSEARITLGALHAVADAFAGAVSPEALVGRAVADAARDELRRISPVRRQRGY